MRAVRVTRPARLGIAALVVLIIAGAIIYFAVKAARGNGYEIGVHFPTAAGVAPGAQVYQSGVVIGSVRKVTILPDASVDFIIAIFQNTDIPKNARFSIESSFTGTSSVTINPVLPHGAQKESPAPLSPDQVLPKRVLPIAEQPVGTPPLTLEAFMTQSRALGDRAYAMAAQARPYGKHLMYHLQNSRANAAVTAQQLRGVTPELMATMQSTITRAKANVTAAQSALRGHNEPKIAAIANAFTGSLASLKRTTDALGSLKRDERMQENIRASSEQLKTVTADMAKLSRDLEMISGSSQTKAQLRDARAQLRLLLQKL